MTRLQEINKTIKENSNIIGRKGQTKRVSSWCKNLSCMRCDEIFDWDTKEKFYLFNNHGWGYCEHCLAWMQVRDIIRYIKKPYDSNTVYLPRPKGMLNEALLWVIHNIFADKYNCPIEVKQWYLKVEEEFYNRDIKLEFIISAK